MRVGAGHQVTNKAASHRGNFNPLSDFSLSSRRKENKFLHTSSDSPVRFYIGESADEGLRVNQWVVSQSTPFFPSIFISSYSRPKLLLQPFIEKPSKINFIRSSHFFPLSPSSLKGVTCLCSLPKFASFSFCYFFVRNKLVNTFLCFPNQLFPCCKTPCNQIAAAGLSIKSVLFYGALNSEEICNVSFACPTFCPPGGAMHSANCYPTDPLTISVPQDKEMGEIYLLHERCPTDSKI